MKRVTVVVLNWNRWPDTLACLASLQAQDYSNFNVLIVDNDSTDDSVKQIRATMPEIELLQSGANLGFGGGCNVGITRALADGADYVWLINSDSTADVHALSALVDVAEQNHALGSVGSVLYEVDSPKQIQLWGGGRVRLCCGQSRHQTAPGPLDFISGASVLLRRTALEAVGMFDQTAFFMYWEDTDLGFRLRKGGWQLAVAEDSRVWHKQSASLGKGNPLLDEYFTRSAVRFLRRYAPVPLASISLMLGMMLAKRLLTGELRRAQAVVKGLLDA
ncbi:glycosyltransferase family 2 protein [Rhodoferax sp.]|uniref:glycosyltransferase family 2 protein n=1 Tax=Rhodoferax sp. TaxID=50421 RepID=UPI0025D5B75A|nr:glycosyltransferase family 2 protein [Rhodoferax sp.]MCM2342364.1 glycosyltransferase family 2 protein [Rhodoferax sp.]